MDQKKATAVVVAMALAMDEKTEQGEALRMVLRELREQRLVTAEIEKLVASSEELDRVAG